MQTVLAYKFAQLAAASEVELQAITDPSMPITNNHFLLPNPMHVLYGLAMGTGITLAKIECPSLRAVTSPYLWPVLRGTVPGADPNIFDYRGYPLPLPRQEEIVVKTSNNDAGTQTHYCILIVEDQPTPPPQGGTIYTVQCTAAITAVANAWTSGNLTFGSQLPSGLYAVVGMYAFGTTMLAARLIIPGGTNMRPGVIGAAAAGTRPPFAGRKAPAGELCRFVNTVPPLLDILCTAADTAQTVYLDLMKVG